MVLIRVQISSARPTDADQSAAHFIGKVHDARRELVGGAAHRPEEIVHQRLAARPAHESRENAEAEGQQRNDRQQARVHQPDGVQVELAAGQIAQQRVRIARQAAQPCRRMPGRSDSGPNSSRSGRC